MESKFNRIYKHIIKEFRVYGRIKLADVDHELITKLVHELRSIVEKSLDEQGDCHATQRLTGGRFNDDRRQIVDVETYISENQELQEKLLEPISDGEILDKARPQRKLKDDPSIIPILKKLVEDALDEAADCDYWYRYEKNYDE